MTQTPEEIIANWIGVPYTSAMTEIADLAAAIQRYGEACAAQERQANIEAVRDVANDYQKALTDAYYAGYKEGIVNALTAIRATASSPPPAPGEDTSG